MLHKVTKIFH